MVAEHRFNRVSAQHAYHGFDTDEARIVRIVAGMSAGDRARMVQEQPPSIPS